MSDRKKTPTRRMIRSLSIVATACYLMNTPASACIMGVGPRLSLSPDASVFVGMVARAQQAAPRNDVPGSMASRPQDGVHSTAQGKPGGHLP